MDIENSYEGLANATRRSEGVAFLQAFRVLFSEKLTIYIEKITLP